MLRSRWARLALCLLVGAAPWFAVPGAATASSESATAAPVERSLRDIDGLRRAARERVDDVRATLETSDLRHAIEAAAELGTVELAPARRAAQSSVVCELLSEVRRAGLRAQRAVKARPETFGGARRAIDRAMSSAMVDGALARRLFARGDLGQGYAAMVDRRALYSAARDLAAAIDRALPRLRALARTSAAPDGRVVGCELVDRPPALCVGGTGENTYTTDYALVIDLGGNDFHANSAGGAQPLTGSAPGGNGLAAAVTVDLGGNDGYRTTLPTASGSTVAQGAGRVGAIGMLVDAAGDDTYSATGTATVPDVAAQGSGIGGVGVLADLGGKDSYVTSSAVGAPVVGVRTQGFSTIAALGVLVDRGLGDDTYLAEVNAAPYIDAQGISRVPQVWAQSVGVGAGGSSGLFVDDGGRDRITLHGTTTTPSDGSDGSVGGLNNVVTGGLGYGGLGGASAVVMGSGATTYESVSRSTGAAVNPASAGTFGFTALGGFAAVSDAAGDDLYTSRSIVEATQDVEVHDDMCTECPAFEVALAGTKASQATQGYAALGGLSLLDDQTGHDRYVSSASSSAIAVVTDARTSDVGPSHLSAVATSGDAESGAQGWGAGAAAAFLEDGQGDDSYLATADTSAAARATARFGSASSDEVPGLSLARAQGIGWGDFGGAAPAAGALIDGGGADAYSIASTATTDSSDGRDVQPGAAGGQGSVEANGIGLLVDLGSGTDTFAIAPKDTACMGTRGKDVWQDCGTALGLGANLGSGFASLGGSWLELLALRIGSLL